MSKEDDIALRKKIAECLGRARKIVSNHRAEYYGTYRASGGGGTTSSNTTSTVPPQVLAEYQNVTQQANQVASQPLNQYGGQIVAGLTPDETAAFQSINSMQGISQPYTQAASGLVGQSTQAINPQTVTAQNIQNYESPYTQQVLNSTMAEENNQDAQQQAQLQGNAISSGAWGGDRSAVAQGILGGQQALANNATNAGILNQGYTQALQEANTQQQAGIGAQEATQGLQAQGALAENQLGTTALSNGLTGASAQLSAGQLQQQQAQSELNVPYEQFLQAQAYPFQTTGWLGNIAEGIGSNEGGSSTSSTTQPSEGLFGLKRGGGIIPHRASGGSDYPAGSTIGKTAVGPNNRYPVYNNGQVISYTSNPSAGIASSAPSTPAAPAQGSFTAHLAPTYSQFAASSPAGGGASYSGGIVPQLNSANQADLSAIYGGKFARGGIARKHFDAGGGDTSGILPAIAQVESGNDPYAVSSAGAGGTYQIMPETAADPGFGVTPLRDWDGTDPRTAPQAEQARFANDYHNAMLNRYNGDENSALMAYNGGPGRVDPVAAGIAPASSLPMETQQYPGKVMAAAGDGTDYYQRDLDASLPPPTPPVNAPDHPSNYISELPQNHEANPWLSVAAGVAGVLAGRSRNPLVDIGQGTLIGLNNYAGQQKTAEEQNYQEGNFKDNAQKLMDETNMQKQQFAEERLRDSQADQYHQGELQRQTQALQQGKNEVVKDMFGNATGTYNKNTAKFTPFASSGSGSSGVGANAITDVNGTPLTPMQMYGYKNLITKQQPKDMAAQNTILPSLIDQKNKVDDLVNQIPVASSGSIHTLQDFADRNQIPVFSDPARAGATVLQNYDSMGNVLDNIKSTFGGTGRVLSKEFEGLSKEMSVNQGASIPQKAIVVAHIQSRINDLIQNEMQRTQDIRSGQAYLPGYQSPEQKRLTAMMALKSGTPQPSPSPPSFPASVPAGSQWSPSRQQFRDSNGTIYDKSGNPI